MDTAKRYVNTVDTAPTVLWALGLEPLPLGDCRAVECAGSGKVRSEQAQVL